MIIPCDKRLAIGSLPQYGYKAHVGTRLVHTVEVAAANVSDIEMAPRLLRPGDSFYCADAGCTGVAGARGGGQPGPLEGRVAGRPKALAGPRQDRTPLPRCQGHVRDQEDAIPRARQEPEHALGCLRARGPLPAQLGGKADTGVGSSARGGQAALRRRDRLPANESVFPWDYAVDSSEPPRQSMTRLSTLSCVLDFKITAREAVSVSAARDASSTSGAI